MIAYKHIFEDAAPISLEELELYGIPESTLEDLRETWEDILANPEFDPRDLHLMND